LRTIEDATEMGRDLAQDLHSQASPKFFTWL
jgi:hypothetical protein